MPSGSGRYFETLTRILSSAQQDSALEAVLLGLQQEYRISNERTARSYVDVAATIGLITIEQGKVHMTALGARAASGDMEASVARGLLKNVRGCAEIVKLLQRSGASLKELREGLAKSGTRWKTSSQVRYRLRWMEEAGLVSRGGRGRATWYSLGGTESI